MKDDIADGNFEIGLLRSTQFHRFDRLHNSGDILRPVGGNDRLHEVADLFIRFISVNPFQQERKRLITNLI